jgi:hypothetical protein
MTYEKPKIEDLGDLVELTAGGTVIGGLDSLIPTDPHIRPSTSFS